MIFESEYFNLGYLDTLSYKDTFVHRLDPRVKILVSFIFILFVVSFPKYELSALMPFFIYPVFLLAMGNIPLRAIAKKVFFVSPFAVLIGIFNPLFDTNIVSSLSGVSITGGWISFISVVMKFILTVSTALILIATTSFPGICEALERLKLPKVFVVQLLFLYRYLFVLLEETLKILRAREARSFSKKGKDIKTFINLLSIMLLRSLERAERIYQAMLSRGFRGEIKVLKTHKLGKQDILFAVLSIINFYAFRKYNLAGLIGQRFSEYFR
jgi:cobalt/nickel transport system permease protein